jgi:uncharacterized protein
MAATFIEKLEQWFRPLDGSLTAFSGGVDSALVLYLSRRFLGSNGIGVIADSPSLKREDLAIAQDFCRRHEITLRVIHPGEIDDPNYAANPIDRCFHCKTNLYSELDQVRSEYPGFALLNGTNCDDLGDYRPGLKAAGDHGILSPLADCGLDKAAIRNLAHQFGLEVWDKPASPCLSSRIPYGQPVTVEKLHRIERAEQILNSHGFSQVRVRHIEETARIEVPVDDLVRLKEQFDRISSVISELGYSRVEMDDEGLVSGKLNRAIL